MAHKTNSKLKYSLGPLKVLAVAVLIVTVALVPAANAWADAFDEQIKALQREVDNYQSQAGALRAQADTLQNQVNALNAEMAALQKQIDLKEAELAQINDTIAKTEQRLDNQKTVLSSNLRSMYLDSQISPLEMIASSKSISDYIDKQTYRTKIRAQVQRNITEIKQLKEELAKQKAAAEQVLADQKSQRTTLVAKQGEQQNLLAQTQGQEAAYQRLASTRNSQIASLRAQQAAANRAVAGKTVAGDPNHGGYPKKWDSPVPQDSRLDDWGMYNRECVSYTAWRVHQDYVLGKNGRDMPYWGDGNGDAKYWDDKAIAAHIPVSGTPKVGSIAISNSGPYGHAMYVEAVLANGQIYVSQYNYGIAGEYTEMTVSAAGLVFIDF